MSKKIYPIAVRFSYEENQSIKTEAYKKDMSLSAFIRDKVFPICSHSPHIENNKCGKTERLEVILKFLLAATLDQNQHYKSMLTNGLTCLNQLFSQEIVQWVEPIFEGCNSGPSQNQPADNRELI